MLAYSDQRLVAPDGKVIADTYWTERRNNYTNFASMLITNTVTGAASLMRRELLEYALPFPPAPGSAYHDHWLGLTALATGEIAYVDLPLYDYVQHADAARRARRARTCTRRSAANGSPRFVVGSEPKLGWRAIYFFECCRLILMATVLLLRCSQRLTPEKRRVLKRLLRIETLSTCGAMVACPPRPVGCWVQRDPRG